MLRSLLVLFFVAFPSLSFALSGLEVYLATRLIDQGTSALFDSKERTLTRPYTHTVALRVTSNLPLSLTSDLSVSKVLPLAPGVLEFHIQSAAFDFQTLTQTQVLAKMNATLGPFLRASFCQPHSFWFSRWLQKDGTLLVRVFSSDGRIVQSYSAVVQDCSYFRR